MASGTKTLREYAAKHGFSLVYCVRQTDEVDAFALPYVESVVAAIEQLNLSVQAVEVHNDCVKGVIFNGPFSVFGHPRTGYLRLPGSPRIPTKIQTDYTSSPRCVKAGSHDT